MSPKTQAAIERLVRQAGRLSMAAYGRDKGRVKPDRTWVTRTDGAVERLLREGIEKRLDVLTFGEEEQWSGDEGAPFVAILDPIDGTDAYRNQMPFWGISVGIFERRRTEWIPALGIFHMPAAGHTFVATRRSATWNGRRVRAPQTPSPIPPESYLGVSSDAHRWRLEGYPGKVRAFGASGLHLLMVATGMLQATLLTRYYMHDIAASAVVLWSAGGVLFTPTGRAFTPTAFVDHVLRQPLDRPPAIIAAHPSGTRDLVACRFRARRAERDKAASAN
jgi:myo-inositol-1(or 4)-monophosphatase